MSQTKVAVVMGSDSDWSVMTSCVKQLDALEIDCSVEVMSAHRSPERVHEFAKTAESKGYQVIIAAAGMSAALAGTIAAVTTLPVIGVPLANGPLQGIDALLSTVQMPPGVPVATVGLGEAGAKNAALLAAQILARGDQRIATTLKQFKTDQAASVARKNQTLQERLK